MEGRIVQIIPAGGWFARFCDEDGYILYRPVACFGLVEREEGTFIEPFVCDAGYIVPASDLRDYRDICRMSCWQEQEEFECIS